MASSGPLPTGDRGALDGELRRHDECMRVISELEECVEHAPGDDSVPRMQDCFAKFSTAVRAQLEQEGKRRLFRDLPTRSPRLANRIDALHANHVRISCELDSLVDTVRELRAPAAHVRRRVRKLIADLRSLEDEETAVLQSAYWRETGVGD